MALQEQVIPLIFASGLETKVDAKQIDAGKLLELQNGIFTTPKEIRKRNGYLALTDSIYQPLSSAVILSGNSLGLLGEALTLTDNTKLYSYLQSVPRWIAEGYKTNVRISSNSLIGNVSTSTYPASLTSANYTLTLSGAARALFSDPLTNTPLRTSFTTIVNPQGYKVTKGLGTMFAYTTQGGASCNLVAQDGAIVGIPNTFDTIVVPTNAPIYQLSSDASFIYLLAYVGTDIVLKKYDIATYNLISTTTVTTPTSLPRSLDLVVDSVNNELVVGYTTATTVTYFLLSTTPVIISTLFNFTASTSLVTTTAAINGTALGIFFDVLSSTDANNYYTQSFLIVNYRTAPAQLQGTPIGYGARIYSTATVNNNVFYVATTSFLPTQNISFILGFPVELNTLRTPFVAGKFGLYTSFFDSGNGNLGGLADKVSWNGNKLPYFVAVNTSIVNSIVTASYNINELVMTFDEKLSNVTLANNINYVGATTSLYDGQGVAEIGYNLFPVIGTLTGDPTGSFAYAYTAIYTWVDFKGNLHRSAEALPQSITLAQDINPQNPLTIFISGYGMGEPYKTQNVFVELYRTQSQGTTYYKVGQVANSTTGLVSIIDTTTSPQISGNQQLYTTGGEVENITPPATNLMTSFKNRLIMVDAENPLQWWFSKQVIQGFPAEFSDLLVQNIDQRGGPITALAPMDDKLVFFKESNAWYVIGDGPSPNGQNNDFTYPQIISSDTGCVEQDSIVLTPGGLFFKSPKGIYLLDRKLGMNYIGSPVERYNSSKVTSTQMIAGTNQIRFSLDSGIVLVYDYLVDQWSTFTNIAASDAIIFHGNYTYLTLTGKVNIETPNVYVDPLNTPINLFLKTGWLSMAGLQGFERVKQFLVLGEAESSTTLSIKMAYDFNETVVQTDNIPVVQSDIPMQYRLFMQRQKCQSIQLTLSDAPTTPTEGLRLSALALNVASKKGPYKKSAANTYG